MKTRLGCIADDYTGATDLSSMLARTGLRVIQLFGVPEVAGRPDHVGFSDEVNRDAIDQADIVVVALKSRSIPADEAVKYSLGALSFLQHQGFDRLFFKYCSTFDSTPQGNIGPVADALADRLGCDQVVFCPSFPENGRTVYQGHLFVGDQLLSESSMREHPLNPMTDSCLVRWLQSQSQRPVGRLGRRSGLPEGRQHVVADAIDDDDLRHIARQTREHRLLTGGSAIARYWAEEIVSCPDRNAHQNHGETETNNGPLAGRTVVLAGSCSAATRQQVALFRETFPVFDLPLKEPSVDVESERAWHWTQAQWNSIKTDTPVLITSASIPNAVSDLRRRLGENEAANFVEAVFASLAEKFVESGVQNLVVAGGETSGAIVNRLKICGVRIGCEIAPGVPRVFPIQHPEMSLVLKSGNFGSERFFFDAIGRNS
ncbi:3-oxo-tetronate kinase [Roseiconus lacunae]|uniref:3-oxo-tetronate kinase n=1 Tax=Roseiconus lacunae TaxID=2605694 RepID=UPI00308E0152|nr:3-oxo-tetronate kinase [Stieleria sp. HD01]